MDETLVELETEKITVEVPAPSAGVVAEITADAGADVAVGQLCVLEDTSGQTASGKTSANQHKALLLIKPVCGGGFPKVWQKQPPKLTAPAPLKRRYGRATSFAGCRQGGGRK